MGTEFAGMLAAFLVGLAGLAHCGPMCGGIQGALTQAVDPALKTSGRSTFPLLGAYNLGRISSYSIAGALAGSLGALALPAAPLMRVVAGVLLVAIGLQIAGIARWLDWLESAGRQFWKLLYPFGRRLLPIRRLPQAFAFGMLWGWLPCGLVYSVLVWSATEGSATGGALIMFSFGLGTLPALLATALAVEKLGQLAQRRAARMGTGLLVILFGLWTALGSLVPLGSHQHPQQTDHGTHHHQHMQLH